jgi:hypothetical protein
MFYANEGYFIALISSFLLSEIKAWQRLEQKKLRCIMICVLASFAEDLQFKDGSLVVAKYKTRKTDRG